MGKTTPLLFIMGNYDFRRDLAVARKEEQKVASLLEAYKDVDKVELNKDKRYDLCVFKADGSTVTIELKVDYMCRFTGNVAVEYESRGKDSGINTSEADVYIYKLHLSDGTAPYMAIPTKRLKGMIDKGLYFKKISGGDKGSNTRCYLFKAEEFIKNAYIIEW